MRNHEELIVGMYSSILMDVVATYPSMRQEVERHKTRLPSIVDARGVSFFTITLPDAAKWLQSCLTTSILPSAPRPPYHGPKGAGDVRPTFMWGLYTLIYDAHGTLLPAPDPTAIFLLRQIYLFAKKFNMVCSQEKVDETIKEFINVEASLPRSRPDTWDDDHPRWRDLYGHPVWGPYKDTQGLFPEPSDPLRPHWKTLRSLTRMVAASMGHLDVWSIRPKHGPGVVSEGKVVKYNFDHYPEKLAALFPPDYFASHDFVDRTVSSREFPSKLACVPKTQKGPRLIACEPTAHQWIQGGIQRWFEDAIRRHPLGLSIDFTNQALSQEMALEASRTGVYCTVDLSAASDRLSTRLVEYIFQSNFTILDALHACRSRYLVIPKEITGADSDEHLCLSKFAPMGSACTFPVQTVVFTILAHFAIMITDSDYDASLQAFRERSPHVRVFGDDIILPTRAYPVLRQILESVLLRVNDSKSYAEGNFREACGLDAFAGFDVTPAYLRNEYNARDPASMVSVIECANNFYKKGLWHASDYLLKTVPEAERKLLPISRMDVGSCSIFTFGQDPFHLKRRMNPYTHSEEVRMLEISAINQRRKGTGEASLLQYYTEAPSPDLMVKWESGQAERPRLRKKTRWVTALPTV